MDKLNPRQGSNAWHISKSVEDAAKSRTRLPNMAPVLYQRYNGYAKNNMVIRCTILERLCMPPVVRSLTTKGVERKRSMDHCREAMSLTIFSLPRSLDFTTRPCPPQLRLQNPRHRSRSVRPGPGRCVFTHLVDWELEWLADVDEGNVDQDKAAER
jgi:hypothetical protein